MPIPLPVIEARRAARDDRGPVTFPAYEATDSGLRQARSSYEKYVSNEKAEQEADQRQRDADKQTQAGKNVTVFLEPADFSKRT